MSLGLSCVDYISFAKFAVDVCNFAQYAVSRSQQASLSELLCELGILAKACERATASLEYASHFVHDLDLTVRS
jgi:hypothetical protein